MKNEQKTVIAIMKVGTESICPDVQESVARVGSRLIDAGHKAIIVSSGAVREGRKVLNEDISGYDPTVQKQVLAALGQPELINSWKPVLLTFGLSAAQVLLTKDDLERASKTPSQVSLFMQNMLRPFNRALKRDEGSAARENCLRQFTQAMLSLKKALIIANEHDSTADDELRIGDNDKLTAMYAVIVKMLFPNAEVNVFYITADALHDCNPRENPDAKPVTDIYMGDMSHICTDGKTSGGSGGMGSKGAVSCDLSAQNMPSFIVPTYAVDTIYDVIVNGAEHVGTKFHPHTRQVKPNPVNHVMSAVSALIPSYRPS